MIHSTRVRALREADVSSRRARHVVYWMQQSQRTRFNHALEYAIHRANELRLPLVTCFGLMDDYPEANLRHYAFMLEGLADVARRLEKRGIRFVVHRGSPEKVAIACARDAALLVCDRGYLRHQKRWRDAVADAVRCRVVEVESDVVVPVEVVSDKAEFAARTIRPKIHRHLATYLKPLAEANVRESSLDLKVSGDIDPKDVDAALSRLKIDCSVPSSPILHGGEAEAQRRLKRFVTSGLAGYADGRRELVKPRVSMLAAYLHFGQISALDIALQVSRSGAPKRDRETFLEELIVRRELAINFVNFQPNYDAYDALPRWAQQTLAGHANDKRPVVYSRDALEHARTHDPYWNAAMTEMAVTGYMHNAMRMYWGKKILEWSHTPRTAYETTLYLNNKYFLDGRDPNAYANVAWIFGLHDRPWQKRAIFGTVRYMNAGGLERKFDIDGYVRRVNEA